MIKITGDRYEVAELLNSVAYINSYEITNIVTSLDFTTVYIKTEGLHKQDDLYVAKQIFDIISLKYGYTEEQIRSKSRKGSLVICRMWISFLISENTKLSLSKIGEYVNRDHSTVIHYKKELRQNITLYQYYREEYEILKRLIKAKL